MDSITFGPHERPPVEVLVDGRWLPGELRMWKRESDGTWLANVTWSSTPAENRSDSFPAKQIRPLADD